MRIHQPRKEKPSVDHTQRTRREGRKGARRMSDIPLATTVPRITKGERARQRRLRRVHGGFLKLLPEPTPRPDEDDPAWQWLKQTVLREERRCRKCGTYRCLTVDHIVPLCKGGGNHRANLQCLCKRCNKRKGGQLPAPAPDLYPIRLAA